MTNCKRSPLLILGLMAGLLMPAQAQITSSNVNQEVISANRLFVDGRVKEGIANLTKHLRGIDATKDKDAYWLASSSLIEMLSQIDDHSSASQIIRTLVATKIPETQSAYFQWLQFYIGRNLAYSGKANEGERFLRALMAGDARLVHIPAQRAAALMMSTIELDRLNVAQSAIWIRRAVIGTLVDKAAASEEIVDVITRYALFLSRTRRLIEANHVFHRLSSIYDQAFPRRGSKYLHFASKYLGNLSGLGHFQEADNVLKILNDTIAHIDIVSNSVKEGLFYDNLYQLARKSGAEPPSSFQPKPIVDRFKKIVADFPDFLKTPANRVFLSYYALVAGELDLADQFISAIEASAPPDEQDAAYEILLKSFIAARRNKFGESINMARDGLALIRKFHRLAENESSGRLPALIVEERLVLGLILGLTAPHVSTFDEANSLFQLQQYMNRDKGKLGLNAWAARQDVKSDLQREDIRSRDRLLALRDRVMEEAVDTLLARALPIKNYSPGQNNDYAPLTRLEEIEDRISRTDDQHRRTVSDPSKESSDSSLDLGAIQKLLRPNEALVMHAVASAGFVTTCIDSDRWTFHVQGIDAAGFQQRGSDIEELMKAVHADHQPSPISDSEFPSESSHRLYHMLFGGIEACLRNKTHLFLAIDPDFFSIPWNAMLTRPPLGGSKYSHRDAAWLPKSYSLSLLPSVRSLFLLRTKLASSRARKTFLGVGAPDLKGAPDSTKQIALAPLFSSRGVVNRSAIAELPALPETADELRVVAKTLGAAGSHMLLGPDATERELRGQTLNDYRVISFATHALVAGEINGVTEPALVLTPGADEYSQKNDGLLTATEIANLALDANIVILSACNTAASDGQASGRGLSGLADAFFFAGARSVAVTQWAVGTEEAKQLGSGLILRSHNPKAVGVAEGLRQTMVDYVSSVPKDYLAHPRFWAAFIIAGDGAVGPLDGSATSDNEQSLIKVDWQELSTDFADAEFMGLTKGRQPTFAVGIQKPPSGEKRAGSYFVRIQAEKRVEVVSRDRDMAASSVVSLGMNIGLLGYNAVDNRSAAVFRLLDKNGREQWQYVEKSDISGFPVSITQTSDGYILISIERDFSQSTSPSTLVLSLVSASGSAIKRQRIPLLLHSGSSSPKQVAIDAKGNLLVAINGRMLEASRRQSAVWTNPSTGSKTYCVNSSATALVSIGISSLQLLSQKIIEDDQIVSFRQRDDHLYAAIRFGANCGLERNVRIAEVGPELELRSIFETNNINSVNVSDFEIAADKFVVVGSIQTLLPEQTARNSTDAQKLLERNFWDDAIWELSETPASAFILVVRGDGTIISDRVFPDVRNRSLSNLTEVGRNRFIAVGSASGDRGWVVSFGLQEPGYNFRVLLQSWLKLMWASLGMGQ